VAASSNPDAVTVMDPFHVVALAGVKLDLIRRGVPAGLEQIA
jgi:transposase